MGKSEWKIWESKSNEEINNQIEYRNFRVKELEREVAIDQSLNVKNGFDMNEGLEDDLEDIREENEFISYLYDILASRSNNNEETEEETNQEETEEETNQEESNQEETTQETSKDDTNAESQNPIKDDKKTDKIKNLKNPEAKAAEYTNITDPKVIFDPIVKNKPIVRRYYGVSYNYEKTEDDMYSNVNNQFNSLKIDGIEYPLVVVNTQAVEQKNILYMGVKLEGFLPSITLVIKDYYQVEQKIQTSQMNGSIEICIVSKLNKIYKNIRMHFRISSVKINPLNRQEVTYNGYYDLEKFRQVNTGFLKKDNTKANFYELLYVIAQKCGLGFAATGETQNIEDRCLRNIYTQRYDQYIENQLNFAGCDEDSVFDAWVDPYNYIVLVNVSWVLGKDVKSEEFDNVAICGIPSTDRDVKDPEPRKMPRILTNYNKMPEPSNLMIKSYSMIINNSAISNGTLERIYTVNWNDSNVSLLDTTDIQTKQNSVDGEYLSEYNTGHNRPLPRFNFNEGGYDLNTQKIIRNHFFNKHRQQVLKIKLRQPNLGLQRGTLVSATIFEKDSVLKATMLAQESNLAGDTSWEAPELSKRDPTKITDWDVIENDGLQAVNSKLTGMYYIDSILFEYSNEIGEIEETLFLIKKGSVSGYNNYHSSPKIKS